jgi:hypothetical protein
MQYDLAKLLEQKHQKQYLLQQNEYVGNPKVVLASNVKKLSFKRSNAVLELIVVYS